MPREPDGDAPAPANRRKNVSWTLSTYFAEGLPWSILHQIAGEYLTAIGVSATQISRTSYLHANTSFKILWSPLVDAFGSLRGWMIAMQAAMGIVIGLLAMVAHRIALAAQIGPADPTWIWVLLIGIGLLSAIHDIACDGYYMDALGKNDQARYSGLRAASFRAAMLVGSSGLVFLGGHVHWLLGFGVGGLIMLGLAVGHWLWLPRTEEPPEPSGSAPRTTHQRGKGWRHIREAYLSFLRQDHVVYVVLFLITYKMADVVMFNMSKVLLARELGIPTDLRGIVNMFSLGASITGAIVGGAWIGRRSLAKTLIPITLLMALTEPLYVAMAAFAPSLAVSVPGTAETMADVDVMAALGPLLVVVTVVVIEQFCGGMATAAQMVFMMRRCHPQHKAAHFAFQTAIYSTFQMVVGGEGGQIYDAVGPVNYFWLASALTIPAVLLVKFVPKD